MIRRLSLLFLLFSSLLAADVNVTASLSSPKAGLEDLVQLQIAVEGADADIAPPDLGRLKDFKIYGGPYTSQSISMVNFKVSRSTTYTWKINPLKTGTLMIPSLKVRVGKKIYWTNPLSLEVVKGSLAPKQPRRPRSPFDDFFGESPRRPQNASQGKIEVRLIPSRRRCFVGQQVTLTYQLLISGAQVQGVSLDEKPSFTGFWVEEVSLPRNPQGRWVTENGERFKAYDIKKYLVFPTAPGKHRIPSTAFRIQALLGGGGFFGFASPEEVVRKSPALTLTVDPLPEAGKPKGFAGAVGSFTLDAGVDKTSLNAGDALAFHVTIKGRGNLKTISPITLPDLPDCKVYEPKTTDKISTDGGSVEGRKSWEWVIIPKSAGTLTLPSVSFAYFDPARRSYRTLSSRPINVKILPGNPSTQGLTVVSGGEEVKRLGRDIAYIITNGEEIRKARRPLYSRWFYPLVLFLPFLFNLTLIAIARQKRRREEGKEQIRFHRAGKEASARLKAAGRAMKEGDSEAFYRILREGIVGFIADKSGRSPEGLTAIEIEEILRAEEGVEEETISKVTHLLSLCDGAIWAPGGERTEMPDLLDDAHRLIRKLEKAL